MFKKRSNRKEFLDADNIPRPDLFRNLAELYSINRLLGGYQITIGALKKVLKRSSRTVLVDIGSGGGDTLKYIYRWNKKSKYNLSFHGVDLKSDCVEYAVQNNNGEDINFICDDYKNILNHLDKVDVIHASLFCHHLSEKEIIDLVQFCIRNQIVLIVNDLERNRFAYYAIKFLTKLFSSSYLVKNDAPLSVLRGFKKQEWRKILSDSGAENYSLRSRWAFRHEVIVYG